MIAESSEYAGVIRRRNFISDANTGASVEVLNAIRQSFESDSHTYGSDVYTAELSVLVEKTFETDLEILMVSTGTAANALALQLASGPLSQIYCQKLSHVAAYECGAAEFYTGGAKLIEIAARKGKLDLFELEQDIVSKHNMSVHQSQPTIVSLSQPNEYGLIYNLSELKEISAICRRHGLLLHMDGARLANALVALDCTPAEMTWKSGVDILSFGLTKTGCVCAESVIIFSRELRNSILNSRRLKRSGHLISKSQFYSSQFLVALTEGKWLQWARQANAAARRLSLGITEIVGCDVVYSVDTNQVFVRLPQFVTDQLTLKGFGVAQADPENGLTRFVTSFNTTFEEIDLFISELNSVVNEGNGY